MKVHPMQNIITGNMSVKDIKEALDTAGKPVLLPPYRSQKWRDIARQEALQDWRKALHERATLELGQPLPELTDELYGLFSQTGDRLSFEKVYFLRRAMLGRAAMCALLYPEETTWLISLAEKTRAVLSEESWALPAHVKAPSGKDPLCVDLFCAETANLMGELFTVFGDVLPATLRTHILERVRTGVIDNFLERHEEFDWTRSRNNWNAVCHQGVLGAAMALEEDTGKMARLLEIAARNLNHFLLGFGKDGGCSEGPGYWSYGFGWFSYLNEQLEIRSGRLLSLFEGDERLRAIAGYGRRVTLEGGRTVNFSDSRDTILPPQLFQYLGERLADPDNLRQSTVNYGLLLRQPPNLDGQRSDFFNLSRFFLHCPPDLDFEVAPVLQDAEFEETQVFISHGLDKENNRWSLAAKGGHNAEHHNHNDCGSYLVQINGVMMIREIGSPEYTRDFLGPARYENLAARSLGHSLPLVNGFEQAAGGERAAKVKSHGVGGSAPYFELDLTDCYPEAAGLKRLIRHIRFEKTAGVITIEDSFDLNEPGEVETAIITDAEVQSAAWGIQLKKDDEIIFIHPDHHTTRIKEAQSHSYRDHTGKDASISRIVLTPPEPKKRLSLKYHITANAEKAK